MSKLFSPFQLKDVTLRNRIAVPPMCQYSAVDGGVTDWHLPHYASLARGGAGLVIVEATAVSPEGRITPACTGIWSDAHVEGLAEIAKAIKEAGAVPGIQIAHAGRKASAKVPWEGGAHISSGAPGAWQPISPSAIAFGKDLDRVPTEMSIEEITRVQADFRSAAKRALEAGFEWLELHYAHGYLGQSFFSVHANQRTDLYGGSAEARGRFLVETLREARAVWPEHLPLGARFGVLEYDGRDEETLAEAIDLSKRFREEGLDFLDVSIGFSTPEAKIPWAPALLAPIAERVRTETGLPVGAAWGMDDPKNAAAAIDEEKMDLVFVGRGHLTNPHYPLATARALGIEGAGTKLLPLPYGYAVERYRR